MENRGPAISQHGVEEQGLGAAATVHWNLSPAELYEQAVRRGEATLANEGALVCHTGEFTGRSPNDKFVVEEPGSKDRVWWGKVNKPIAPEKFDALLWYPSHYEGFESCNNVIYTGASPNQHIIPLLRYVLREHGRRAYCVGSNYIWAWENNRILREIVQACGGAVLAEQRLQLQARGLSATVSGTAPDIDADPDKLQIVFANLIGNAVSFSPDGGEIRLALSRVPGWVRVDCIDQGPGVPADDAERIFEPFYQGRRRPSVACHGSGLGLSIVREFVLAHGGRVYLLPAARGAHFRVELPHDL